MARKLSLIRKLGFAVLIVLAVAALAWVFSQTNRPATARAYFWLEGMWIQHWPMERGRWEIRNLVPVMCRAGILAPVRMQVEPSVSFLLDPRDLVPVTILRTGQWQPEAWDSIS